MNILVTGCNGQLGKEFQKISELLITLISNIKQTLKLGKIQNQNQTS